MDYMGLFRLERTAYKSIKDGNKGKDLAKSLIKPGLLFCVGTLVETVMFEIVESIFEYFEELE